MVFLCGSVPPCSAEGLFDFCLKHTNVVDDPEEDPDTVRHIIYRVVFSQTTRFRCYCFLHQVLQLRDNRISAGRLDDKHHPQEVLLEQDRPFDLEAVCTQDYQRSDAFQTKFTLSEHDSTIGKHTIYRTIYHHPDRKPVRFYLTHPNDKFTRHAEIAQLLAFFQYKGGNRMKEMTMINARTKEPIPGTHVVFD